MSIIGGLSYRKVDAGHAVHNDEDILISQSAEAEVHTSYKETENQWESVVVGGSQW